MITVEDFEIIANTNEFYLGVRIHEEELKVDLCILECQLKRAKEVLELNRPSHILFNYIPAKMPQERFTQQKIKLYLESSIDS